VSEHHPSFSGVYNGKASDPTVRDVFEHAECRIGLGSWATSKNLGGARFLGDDWATASHEGVRVGTAYFPDVRLEQFVPALRRRLVEEFGRGHFSRDPFARAYEAGLDVPQTAADYLDPGWDPDGPFPELGYDSFFQHIDHFLAEQTTWPGHEPSNPFTVISDAGFSLLGSMNLRMAERGSYIAQNSWLSIGYSVGAATGVALARGTQGKRPMVFVGDGSFQETCQEMSTHVRNDLSPVVFVFDNEGFYGIEQMLVHPCYYEEGAPRSDGADFYNVLHPWNYDKLAEVFGSTKQRMTGQVVHDHEELVELLARIGEPADPVNDGPLIVRVVLDRHDYPRALRYKIDENCPPPVGV
jgi:indolepyruvate decarboxylase